MKGLRFYLICKADMLAWYSFMDIGRRCETPGSEIGDSLTFTTLTIVKVSAFCFFGMCSHTPSANLRVTQNSCITGLKS